MSNTLCSRRGLLKRCVLAAACIPMAEISTAAPPAQNPLLSPEDPTAKALKYVHDAKQAKEAKPGTRCDNCRLYQGAPKAAQGPCAIFPGKDVKAAGWCASWIPKQA